uniref:2-keto-4-pentenoate hydratase n=1 Tax=Aerococcus urinaeequi TaxID=51665 RepID=UPI00352A0D20
MTKLDPIVNQLLEVYLTKQPTSFISETTQLTEKEAYLVQHFTVQKKTERFNEERVGYKISMTSPETQAFFDADEPAYGTLTNGNLLPNKATVKLSELNEPLLEVECMICLQQDISEEDSLQQIYEKVSFKPGIEIPDSRFQNWFPRFELMDLIADNGVTGHVLVPEEEYSKPSIEDVGQIHMTLSHEDQLILEGNTSVVLNHPLHAVKWLAKKLTEQNLSLKEGMVLSSGSLHSPIPLKEGVFSNLLFVFLLFIVLIVGLSINIQKSILFP